MMKKGHYLADGKTAVYLDQLSKAALIDLVFDLGLAVHGEENEFRADPLKYLKQYIEPVLNARGDKIPTKAHK